LSRIWFEESWQLLDVAADDFTHAYADLPAVVRHSHPDLQLPGSIADVVVRTPDEDPTVRARFIMRHYMQAGLDYLNTQTEPSNPVDRIERLTAAMVALRHEGRVHDALVLGPRIDRELAGLRRREQWGRRSVQSSWFMLEWGLTHMLAGEHSAAIALFTRAYETNPTGLTGSKASGLLALTHGLLGDSAESRRWLAQHEPIEVSGWWIRSRALMPARLARASAALDRLDCRAAAEELDDSVFYSDYPGSELWPAHLRLCTRLALLDGDPLPMLSRLAHLAQLQEPTLVQDQNSAARAIVDRCRAELLLAVGEVDHVRHLVGEGSDLTGWRRIIDARRLLITGDDAQAQRTAVAAAWSDDTVQRDRAELLMIGAVAALRRGREPEAASAFRRAHAACGQAETLEPYLTCLPDELTRLLALSGVTLEPEASAAIGRGRTPYPTAVTTVDLSPREREVLRLMRTHDTAAGIARALSVSVNTVRKQQASIYAKLDVHDRTSALLVAEQLGFFGRHRSSTAPSRAP